MAFLELSHIAKHYEGKKVLRDVSLQLGEQELLVVVGKSGTGKSSLLRIIAGLLDADNGKVALEGETLKGPKRSLVPGYEEIKLVHQDLELHPFLKLHELVRQNLSGYTREFQEERSEELLRLAGLWEDRDKLPREISGGQQQKVAISAALANEPKLLLLDEPFSNLDPFSKHEFLTHIKQEAFSIGTTIILVTHDTRDALLVADRIVVMDKGEIVQDGTPDEIYQKPSNQFTAQFFGPVNILKADKLKEIWPEQINGYKGELGIRPEGLQISNEGVCGKVKSQIYQGSNYLITVSIQGQDLRVMSKESVDAGSEISVKLNSERIMRF